MDTMFENLTATAEGMIRSALTLENAISPVEIQVREKIARQVLNAWATGTAGTQAEITEDFSRNFDAEYERLDELIAELSQAVPAMA